MSHRRMTARRARADLAWLLAAVAVLHIGLAIAIEHWLPEFRDPYFAHRAALLRERIRAAPSPPAVAVMLGSSRTQNGLRPTAIEAELARELGRPMVLFNFGVPGAGPVRNLLHLRRLLADGVQPDLVLLEVVPLMLSEQAGGSIETFWLPADRLRHDELAVLQRYQFPARKLRKEWWRAWPVPWFSHRMAILSRLRPELLPDNLRLDWARDTDNSGWTPMTGDMTPAGRARVLELTRREHGDRLQNYRLYSPACAALRETLALCRAEGIAAALVLMPEGGIYQTWYPPHARPQVAVLLADLDRAFAVPVIDAHAWVSEEGFYDSNHLLPDGASRFTERLGREVVLPMLRDQAAATR